MADELGWEWLGRVGYLDALERQRLRRDAILAGEAPEVVWLLEHDPVITTGRRGGLAPDQLRAASPPVVETERGGLATYHGPGQLVGYLLVDVGRRGGGVRRTVEAIEAAIGGWLGERGVSAGPRAGFPGVWVGRDKICAVGMHFKRGVSMHGFALNLNVDLDGFSGFVPCGVTDGGVTSLARIVGSDREVPPPAECASSVATAVLAALERSWSCG